MNVLRIAAKATHKGKMPETGTINVIALNDVTLTCSIPVRFLVHQHMNTHGIVLMVIFLHTPVDRTAAFSLFIELLQQMRESIIVWLHNLDIVQSLIILK